MKKQKEFETWAKKKLAEIQKVLLLDHFAPLEFEMSDKMEKNSIAEFNWTHPYQSIKIYYHKDLMDDFYKGKKESVFGVLVHEMCHALTDPLYDHAIRRYTTKEGINDEREKLTDHLANVILRLEVIKLK